MLAREAIRWRILGVLEIVGQTGPVRITAPRRQIVLSMLLLGANRVVSIDRLVDAVWGDSPPSTARSQIQICVSALRKQFLAAGLPNEVITCSSGYQLDVAEDEVDLHVFNRLATEARGLLTEGRAAEAVEILEAALGLWRGEAFFGIESEVVQAVALQLAEQRLAGLGVYVDACLATGTHREMVGDLMKLVADNPLHERFRGQLMVALYRSGRQAEALESYREGRDILVEDLGLEPSEELRRLKTQILTKQVEITRAEDDDPEADASPPADPVPRMLPVDIPDFVGRSTLSTTLLRSAKEAGPTTPLRIAVISGSAGIGKTALAVHVAAQLRYAYPGGQLFARLGGTDDPAATSNALERFLRALSAAGSALPTSIDERAEMYRNRLAAKRVLVVLDDVGSERQILPLLPSGAGSCVVVTSSHRLTGLPGADQYYVGPMDLNDASQLLARVVGAGRLYAEPAAARQLVHLCGGHPLALRIAAARLAARPHWTVSKLVDRLKDEDGRLEQLKHGGMEVRSTIGSAYRSLSDRGRQLLRRLVLLNVADFTAWVAAPLLDIDAQEAEDVLDELVDEHLLEVDRGDPRPRYHLHNLTRIYARERLAADEDPAERDNALHRVLGAWLYVIEEQHRREYGGDFTTIHGTAKRWPIPESELDDLLDDPFDWFEAERVGLVAAIHQAAENGLDELCWDLALSAVTIFEASSYFDAWRETHEIALAAVRRTGNERGIAAVVSSLGALALLKNRFDEARVRLTEAIESFDRLGERHGWALALRNVAHLERIQGDQAAARRHYEDALRELTRVGDRAAEVHVLSGLGQLRLEQGDHEEARKLVTAALEIAEEIRSRRMRAQLTYRFGDILLRQDDLVGAEHAFRTALGMLQTDRDVIGRAYNLRGMGSVAVRRGRYREAQELLVQALRLAAKSGGQLVTARTNLALAELHREVGAVEEAVSAAARAMEIFTQLDATRSRDQALRLIRELDEHPGVDGGVVVGFGRPSDTCLPGGSASNHGVGDVLDRAEAESRRHAGHGLRHIS